MSDVFNNIRAELARNRLTMVSKNSMVFFITGANIHNLLYFTEKA